MRRRTRPKVVWLPQTNANSLGANATTVYQKFALQLGGDIGDFTVGEIPLVIDDTHDPLAAATTLADVEDSGYRLRRIVGKIWVNQHQSAGDTPGIRIVTAGIIVRRTDVTTGASLASLDTTGQLQSPGEIQNTADPWVWRRSWLLANNLATIAALNGETYPDSNQFFSAVDGPHVDQKTARIIGPEERLFLNVSSTIVTAGMDLQTQDVCDIVTDLRVLGSMRTTVGNRRNASR